MELANIPYTKLKTLLSKVRDTRSKTIDGQNRYEATPEQSEKWWMYFRMEQRILESLEFSRGMRNEKGNRPRYY